MSRSDGQPYRSQRGVAYFPARRLTPHLRAALDRLAQRDESAGLKTLALEIARSTDRPFSTVHQKLSALAREECDWLDERWAEAVAAACGEMAGDVWGWDHYTRVMLHTSAAADDDLSDVDLTKGLRHLEAGRGPARASAQRHE